MESKFRVLRDSECLTVLIGQEPDSQMKGQIDNDKCGIRSQGFAYARYECLQCRRLHWTQSLLNKWSNLNEGRSMEDYLTDIPEGK